MIVAIWRLAEMGIMLLAAAGYGWMCLRAVGIRAGMARTPLMWALLSLTLGLGAVSYATLAIGLAGWLRPPVVWAMLLVGGVVATRRLVRPGVLSVARPAWRAAAALSRPFRMLLASLVLLAALSLVGALAPPLGADDLSYHLAVPKRYVAAHAIRFIPDKYYSNLPYTMEMLWTAAITIDDGELAQVLNWAIGLLAVAWIALLAREVGADHRAAVLAGFLFYSISTVGDLARSGNTEGGATTFLLATVVVLFQWRRRPQAPWVILAGALAGLYAGTKLPNPVAVAMLALWLGVLAHTQRRNLRRAAGIVGLFGLVAAGVVSVWYVKTWVMTGNPVYPFLQSALGGPPIRAGLLAEGFQDLAAGWMASLRYEHPIRRLLLQPVRLVMDPQYMRGHISPMFVALLPVAVWTGAQARFQLRPLLALAVALYVYWAPTYLFVRAGLPVLALMSVLVADATWRVALLGAATKTIVGVLLAGWYLTSLAGVLADTAPAVRVVAGTQSVHDYLQAQGPQQHAFAAYDAYLFMNQHLPPTAKVLLWESRGYYLDRPYIHAAEFVQTMADPLRVYDPAAVIDELRRFGITHVAMTDNHLRLRLRRVLESTHRLRCLYQGRAMLVCALPR